MGTKWIRRAIYIGCCALMLGLPSGTGIGAVHHRDGARAAATPSRGYRGPSLRMVLPAGYTNPADDEPASESGLDGIDAEAADSIIKVGLRNGGRILPLAKQFTIEALHRTAVSVGLPAFDLDEAERQINAIDSVVLDNALYDWAEIDLSRPTILRVGVAYAFYLSTNEEAVFLLGHELTHIAAWRSDIEPLMDSISAWSARVAPDAKKADVKEDLACDFIGAQALKLYMFHYPSVEPVDVRIVDASIPDLFAPYACAMVTRMS